MGISRLRLFAVLIGALLVATTFTYPSWRPEPVEKRDETELPGLATDLLPAFAELPARELSIYLDMYEDNSMMAIDLLTARLTPPEPLPPEEQALPPIPDAVIVRQGAFAPVELEEDDEREMPPYSDLYVTAGAVTIFQFPDESRFVRIENLSVLNGPNLWVALSPNSTPLKQDELGRDYIDLGPLPSTSGNMNFNIPDLGPQEFQTYHSIVIYDRTYGIIFGVAQIG